MKLVARCDTALQAAHLANVLCASGIRAEVRNTTLQGALGDIPWLECAPQVWVLDALDASRAALLLDELRHAPPQAGWRCAGCGEWLEGQFAACWRCGADRAAG
jgi:hypothetical protein